ncbi:threonine/serine ThrE exporter family protein [Nocardioides caldifontis]|uniref:threonine/serine ThrE exporter family protein n=1 Tax=Nocardioides caldifontis TaxID=2588938 RepID=UPI0011DF3FDF|nr:threonine/serine exporter family protein [Nocardioides caldifontis]
MPDDTYKTLDLALRIGEMLLSSGAGAADVTATMLSVTHALGLRGVSADVTFTEVSLVHHPVGEGPAVVQVRHVTHREIDYEDLTLVDHLVRDLVTGVIDRDEARTQMNRLTSSGHRRPRWAVTLGWGVMGAGVAVLLGGELLVIALAFVAACLIDRIQRYLTVRRFPIFYQQVAGGAVATLLAVGAAATGVGVNPSHVVTAGIVMLLAGIGFMGATQDALTGFPLTASARMMEVVLLTAGILAGVSLGLTVGELLGFELGRVQPGAIGLAEASMMAFGAGVTAAAFAFSSYAPLRALLPVAAVGALGTGAYAAVGSVEVGRPWASAVAAVFIGVVSYSVAGRVRVPPLVVVVPAIVPLLPGLAIFRGLAGLADGGNGMLHLATAGATAIALAAGVILGQYIAQPLKREARKLETRLSGPRLVGPLRVRAVRRAAGRG